MPDAPCVQRLIEEMLESGSSAEEVCRDTPELLPQVREGWRRLRAVRARLDELFPESRSGEDHSDMPPEDGPNQCKADQYQRFVGRNRSVFAPPGHIRHRLAVHAKPRRSRTPGASRCPRSARHARGHTPRTRPRGQ